MPPKATSKPFDKSKGFESDMAQEQTTVTYAVSMGNPLVSRDPAKKFAYQVSIPYSELTPGTILEDRIFTSKVLLICRNLHRDELLASKKWKCLGTCGNDAKEIKFGYTVLMGPPKGTHGMGGPGEGALPLFLDDAAVPFCGEESCFQKTKVALESIHARNLLDLRLCENCGKGGDGIKKCSRCKSVVYCSPECQSKRWREHKKECSPP
ncbi:hypothetical protein BJ508DRAFT_321629 [Ascobolus immersus RN42]|uniref:MYND-type domain-containing protein n=1 Tax=Ascobolus immersus RN42 TaxID=1160509 RepID=A0A3N4IQJ8_ASCIM|nr:hypothetical protein BJ508DRAFT_321629 [Ascobolus immersus RN42]